MRHVNEAAAIAAVTLIVSACSSMLTSDQPPDTTYWLEPAPIGPVPGADAENPSIRVAVSAAPGLNVDRILVRGPGATLNSYTAARWPDNIPDIVESLVRAALEDSGRFTPVAPGRSGTRTDWQLDLEVRAFFAIVSDEVAPPLVRLQVRGYLACSVHVLPVRVSAEHGARANSLAEITAAFQSVVNDGLTELVELLVTGCVDPTGRDTASGLPVANVDNGRTGTDPVTTVS